MLTRRTFISSLGMLGLSSAIGCDVGSPTPVFTSIEHPGFPYHPVVYHLDLATLAYQIYGQSLLWPFDPYYEEMNRSPAGRSSFMQSVRSWVTEQSRSQGSSAALMRLRGPGVLSGFPNNMSHDPILYRYGNIYPWSHCLNFPESRWLYYKTPHSITKQIKKVFVAYRKPDGPDAGVVLEELPARPKAGDLAPNANDVLFCFEGGTGGKGESGQPHSYSLMGYVLLRRVSDEDFDIHIVFRGSRSGSASRALIEALSTREAKGNPDWITDLGWFPIAPEDGAAPVTTVGSVYRGFATSMKSMLPCIFRCLEKISSLNSGKVPRNIYTTGHSLGGGLAQHFASSVLLGDLYGPGGKGSKMPRDLKDWPWRQMKLISFSAPRAGDEEWARRLTEKELESTYWSHPVLPVDVDAFAISRKEIVLRLLDSKRPAAYRVLISNDPITLEKVVGGKHVGKTVYADAGRSMVPNFKSHEVGDVRRRLLATLRYMKGPVDTWSYFSREDLLRQFSLPDSVRGGVGEVEMRLSVLRMFSDKYGCYLSSSLAEDARSYVSLFGS